MSAEPLTRDTTPLSEVTRVENGLGEVDNAQLNFVQLIAIPLEFGSGAAFFIENQRLGE
jgi:hypothetical protein